MVKPSLNAFLICERVQREKSGQCSLLGVFQHLHAPSYPLPPRSLAVYLNLNEVVPPTRLELQFKDPAGRLIQKAEVACEAAVPPSHCYEISLDFSGVVFQSPGSYDFELRADGQLLAMRSLQLSLSPPAA